MKKYAFLNNIKDKQLKNKISNILDEILYILVNEEKNNLISISVFGSFSRGEAVYKITDKKTVFLSDLDVLVIVRKKTNKKIIENKIHSINNLLEIDLSYKDLNEVRSMSRDTHTLDKSKGITIYGKEVSQILPKVRKIENSDSTALFFNRLKLNLIDLTSFDYFSSKNVKSKMVLSQQAAKMIFTAADIINIYYDDYKPGIKERCSSALEHLKKNKRIKNEDKFSKHLNNMIKFYFDEKKIFLENPKKNWILSKDYLFDIYDVFGKKQKNKFGLKKYAKKLANYMKFRLFNPLEILRRSAFMFFKSIKIKGIDKNKLEKSKFYIEKFRINSKNISLDEMRNNLLKIGFKIGNF